MVVTTKKLKVRVNSTVSPEIKKYAQKFAKERYKTSLSALVEALLTDFVAAEQKKNKVHMDQGALL